MGLGGVCHRMVMGYAAGTPGAGLRVIFDLKAREPVPPYRGCDACVARAAREGCPGPPVSARGARNSRTQIEPARRGSFLVQLERREASVVSSIPARSPIPKARAAAL
jgi:hypothetical protein